MDRSLVVREMMPQDLKLETETLTIDEAINAARYLAGVVGHAHPRQMSTSDRRIWHKAFAQSPSKTLKAPSCIWTSIVDLVAMHEAAYLDIAGATRSPKR